MDFILYPHKAPIMKKFMQSLLQNPSTQKGAEKESEMWTLYRKHGCPHSQLINEVNSVLGKNIIETNNPTLDFLIERMWSFANDGNNSTTTDENIKTIAAKALEMCDAYTNAFEQSYPITNELYPKGSLLEILSWTNFPEYFSGTYNKPGLAIVSLMEGEEHYYFNLLFKLVLSMDKKGKQFFIGPKMNVGFPVLQLARSKLAESPTTYPYKEVCERGGLSPEYFVNDYVHKYGLSPHQNVIMTALGSGSNSSPQCRIKEYDKKIWLMKIDFGQKGWNPED